MKFKNQAKLLREYRLKRGLSQGQVADAVVIHKQFISNMERGLCGITKFKINNIQKTLKIPKTKLKKAFLADQKLFIDGVLK